MKKMIIILTKIKGGAETILQTTWPVTGLDWLGRHGKAIRI